MMDKDQGHLDEAYQELFVRLITRHDRAIRVFLRGSPPTAVDVDEVMQRMGVVTWRKFAHVDGRSTRSLLFVALFCVFSVRVAPAEIAFDADLPEAAFAAKEVEEALGESKQPPEIRLTLDETLNPQAYRIAIQGTAITVQGGDARGVMYGGLELAEQIRIGGGIASVHETRGAPRIPRRGLKFNIPLDIRTPSYQDAGDSAQNNITEMWNFEFWREYLDDMARHRYNVLTLWNPHPFPSMIQLDDYPDIALQDVCGTSFPLDTDRTDESEAKFIAGCGVSQQVLDNLIVLKPMTIEEKITFWRRVMRYAKDRGIDVYFVTWNVWMNSVAPPGWYRGQELKQGDRGKYGINNDQENPRTVAYLRACVREFLLTYPDLAGIGLTAGENMEDRDDQYDREKWLWATFGEGVLDAKRIQPDREIGMIHRVWQSGMSKMMDDFVRKYPDEINLSYKYARARMYSTPDPPWSDDYVKTIRGLGVKSWWNIRNDDIFHFRWGDPEYVRTFIRNLPPEDVTAGYYMGSDGYVWGRESISVHPNHPRDLEIRKHWFNFMLWGRLGYDPDLGATRIEALLQHHFPEVDATTLLGAWTSSSRIIPLVNRFHWRDWDFMWAVEGCLDLRKGFHSVEDFINVSPIPGSDLQSIPEFVEACQDGRSVPVTTPLDVARRLEDYADAALEEVRQIRQSELIVSKELSELLYDIEAISHLGNYYASKIRGAVSLQTYFATKDGAAQADAVRELKTALAMWRSYTKAATANYRAQFMAKTRTIDWIRLTDDVRRDIEIAASADVNGEE